MKYIKFDELGFIKGIFNDEICHLPLEEEYILVTNELADVIANYPVGKLVKLGNLIDTNTVYDDINLILKLTPIDPTIALNNAKTDKINQLKHTCEKNIISGFESDCLGEIKKFDCADYDQRNILGLVAKAQLIASGGQTDGMLEWKATDEEECYQWTPQQVIKLGADMYTHISSNLKEEQRLRKVVKNATTVEEVNAVIWE